MAESLLVLAVAGRSKRRSITRIRYALTTGCFIDLESAERVGCDEDRSLVVRNRTPTGSPAHDLVVTRIAESGRALLPSTWLPELSPAVWRALLGDAEERGVITSRTRRGWGLARPSEYDVAARSRVGALAFELERAYEGFSRDPVACTLISICAAAALPELLPHRPRYRDLRRVGALVQPSPMVDSLRDAVMVHLAHVRFATAAGGG